MSTRVRVAPRLRRFTVAVPVAPLEIEAPKSANTCGRLFRMSSMRVTPSILMSCAVTTATGLVLSMFGDGMRVPVTSMRSPRSAVWAKARGVAINASANRVAVTQVFSANGKRIFIFERLRQVASGILIRGGLLECDKKHGKNRQRLRARQSFFE